jgi:hypothetical protein
MEFRVEVPSNIDLGRIIISGKETYTRLVESLNNPSPRLTAEAGIVMDVNEVAPWNAY